MRPLPVPEHTTSLHLDAWVDPVIDTVGHDPRSAYVERFWLATLGPSTVWLLRHLAERLEAEGPCTIDLADTAQALGLGRQAGRPTQLLRSINRSCTFGTARYDGHETLHIRRRLPPLSRRQVEHLPDRLRAEHHEWQRRELAEPEHLRLRRRAQQLALSLLDLGETYEDTERMLHRWRFHPALAHDAMRWATAQRSKPSVESSASVDPVVSVDPVASS